MRTFVNIENAYSTTYVDINTRDNGKNAGYSDVFVNRDVTSIPAIRAAIVSHMDEFGVEGVYFTNRPNELVARENVGDDIESLLRI